MHTQESAEMYLETIYILLQRNGSVRSMDIADYMNFTRPSVCRGVGLLKKGNYILMDQDGFITLTDTGREAAKKIYERHTILSDFLIRLGVDEKTAAADACRIEHVISDTSFEAMKRHVAKNTKQNLKS